MKRSKTRWGGIFAGSFFLLLERPTAFRTRSFISLPSLGAARACPFANRSSRRVYLRSPRFAFWRSRRLGMRIRDLLWSGACFCPVRALGLIEYFRGHRCTTAKQPVVRA